MKTILLFAIILLAQNITAQDSLLTYTEVIKIDGTTKEQLFTRARQWFNDAWKNSKEVLQITDKETGELSGKGIISTYYDYKPPMGAPVKVSVDCNVTVSVFVKDGRYKYEFTNFKAEEGGNGMAQLGTLTTRTTSPVKFAFSSQKKSDGLYQNFKMHLDERMQAIIANLKSAMNDQKSKLDF